MLYGDQKKSQNLINTSTKDFGFESKRKLHLVKTNENYRSADCFIFVVNKL